LRDREYLTRAFGRSAAALGQFGFALLLFLALCVSSPSQALAKSPERDFVDGVLRELRQSAPDRRFRISRERDLTIEERDDHGGWSDGAINLDRVYQYCLNASAEDCAVEREAFVTGLLAPDPPQERDALRIIVRGADYTSALEAAYAKGSQHIVSRSLGADLRAILAFDSPKTIGIATPDMIARLGLGEQEAWRLALVQTKAMLPVLPLGELTKGQPGSFENLEYLGSLLADLDEWKEISAKAGPDLFVTVTSDNFVLIGFVTDGDRLKELAAAAQADCAAAPRCISPHVYRFRDGQWSIADGA